MLLLLLSCNKVTTPADSAGVPEPVQPPVDLDGDGYGTPETGGDDCDDLRWWIHPGADELCTDEDEDCDGEPLAPGVCGEVLPAEAWATWIMQVESSLYSLPIRDVTGDGHDDILHSGGSSTWVRAGDGTVEGFADAGIWAGWGNGIPADASTFVLDFGDLDGDQNNDLVLYGVHDNEAFYVIWGPVSSESAWSRWYVERDGAETDFGYPRVGDVDGDGTTDILNAEQSSDGCELAVFHGGSRAESTLTIQDYDLGCPWTVMDPIGDVDGDGASDVIVSENGEKMSYLIPGAELVGAGSVDFAGLSARPVASIGSIPSFTAYSPGWQRVGDLSGDGLDDAIAVVQDLSEDEQGVLFFGEFGGDDVDPTGIVLADIGKLSAHFGNSLSVVRHDGVPQYFVIDNFRADNWVTFAMSAEWREGTYDLSEIDMVKLGSTPDGKDDLAFPSGWGEGDLDEDGWTDVIFASADGRWLMRPLEDVPWGELSYW